MAATSQPGRRLIPAPTWPRPRFLATRALTRGSTLWWVAGYNALVALISLTCAAFLPETRGRDLQVDEAPAPGSSTLVA